MTAYLLLLIAACAADVFTTARNLKSGGREVNYLPAWLIDHVGVWPTLIGTKVVMVGAAIAINEVPFYVVMAALNLAAAAWNWTKRAR